jgi:DNA ligase 1
MIYRELAKIYDALESTSKRLEKIKLLSDFFKKISEEESEVLYLILGNIYASYDERKIGISNQLTIKAISVSTGINKERIINEWKKIGDLGEVVEKLVNIKTQSTLCKTNLTVMKVLENLRKLPLLEGKGTVNKKINLIAELLTSASPLEAKYIVRTLLRDLRIGVQENTIRDAIASAFFRDKEAIGIIQRAFDNSNDFAIIFKIAKKRKLRNFKKISIVVGRPIKAMLAQKATSIEQGFKDLGSPCAIEFKYDGFRLIIHKDNSGKIILFTRSLENVTKQFPEVLDYIKKYIKGDSFILDSEAVGYNKKTKKYTSFQSISQRIRRKYNIELLQKKLPIEVNVFDILYYNGKSLIEEPFKKRTNLLRKIIKNKPYQIVFSKQIITDSVKKVQRFYSQALDKNQEGIMMKNLSAIYHPGRRVGYMLKLKPEERDLDLVITGAEYGTGKRSGWLTSFILSCKDPKSGDYLEVGKVSTGLKEKKSKEENSISYEELSERLKPYIYKENGKKVKIKPKIIVSVTYQEIQKSPNYNSGIALRFPRFISIRDDKHLSEINTFEEISKELNQQKKENYKYG